MQDLLIVKDPLDSKLTVGAPSENYIAFAITAEKAVTTLQVQITIPCGEATAGEKFLCANGNEARLTPSSQPGDKLTFLCTRKEKSISWKTQQFKLDAGENIVIRIGGFNPELPGDASLQLKLVGPGLADNKSYKVSVAPALGVSILYFEATPANVLQQNTVNITVKTAGAKTIKLYANDAPVKELEPAKTTETVTAVRYIHKPQVNTTYHLKAWQSAPGDDDEADVRNGKLVEHKLTVLVRARPEWYSWDLLANSLDPADAGRDFYPTLLLTGEDLSGETKGEKLYGIFVCKETKQAELWSSATGEDNWSYLGDVPDGMAESPGVIHKQALWLIGGGAADPLCPVTDRVWWYYKNEDQEMVWKEWDEDSTERKTGMTPPPRRCHACAVLNGAVWVLGGLSEQNKTLDDVWTSSADPAKGKFKAEWKKNPQPLPSRRCLPVVTTTPAGTDMKVDQPRLWLCGGATHPYNFNETFYELWWTVDGTVWKSLNLPQEEAVSEGKIQVLAAALLYDRGDRLLHLAGVFQYPGKGFRTHDYRLLNAAITTGWDKGSLGEFGWRYGAELFLIRSVFFKDRWIFSPLYQDQASAASYKARIYVTPAPK